MDGKIEKLIRSRLKMKMNRKNKIHLVKVRNVFHPLTNTSKEKLNTYSQFAAERYPVET